jgi:RNA polymerase sigma-70 factor (ECF subfamily)
LNTVSPPDVDKSEIRLVENAAAGDRAAQRELFELHREVAYRVALRVTGRHEDALDAVQDAFIRAFDRLGDFQGGSSFRTWLLRIVTNRALDLLRARKVRLAIPLDGGEDDPTPAVASQDNSTRPGQKMEDQELGERLQRAIESLPAEQRAAFALYATGEMTYGQIAETLGIPIGTVMSRLYHARRKLHEMLPDLAPPKDDENS